MSSIATPPILLIVFNRLDNTKKVFKAIKNGKPKKLYISSDGPREQIKGEEDRVLEIRKFLLDSVDWDCEVKTLFHETNQGCKKAPHEAISWLFKNEEKGIVLEDDCVPSQDFFKYTSLLLDKYENDLRIFGISGTNFQSKKYKLDQSYYFSRFFMTWGWATWKSRWDIHLEALEDFQSYLNDSDIYKLIPEKIANIQIVEYAKKAHAGKLDTWDYQWHLSCMINNGLIATPSCNLIENIGFGADATHTTTLNNRQVPFGNMLFPIKHPKILTANHEIDKSFYKNIHLWLSTKEKIFNWVYMKKALNSKIKRLLKAQK